MLSYDCRTKVSKSENGKILYNKYNAIRKKSLSSFFGGGVTECYQKLMKL